jgi:glutaredoxin
VKHLENLGIPFDYLDVDQDEDAKQWVITQNDGKQKTPTVKVANKVVLSEPSDAELDVALRKTGIMRN